MKFVMTVAGLIAVAASCAQAHDPATHVYLASQTFAAWQTYDHQFYTDLCRPQDDYEGFLTRKLYYIGATLPDLLLPAQQQLVCSVLTRLHDFRPSVRAWYGEADVSLTGPLDITDTTFDNTRTPISYASGELPMNSNFPKVYQMVQYAKARGWSSKYGVNRGRYPCFS